MNLRFGTLAGLLWWLATTGMTCLPVALTGCVGTFSSGMRDNGSYFFKIGTDVEAGHRTSKTNSTAQTDSTVGVVYAKDVALLPSAGDGTPGVVVDPEVMSAAMQAIDDLRREVDALKNKTPTP